MVVDYPHYPNGYTSFLTMAIMSGGLDKVVIRKNVVGISGEKTRHDLDMLKKAEEKRNRKKLKRLQDIKQGE